MRFRRYWLGGTDRLSIPEGVNQTVRQKMLALYQPQRIASKALWSGIKRISPGIRLPGVIESANSPSERLKHLDWKSWVHQVADILKLQNLSPAFYFPADHGRAQCAALLLDENGDGAFAKLSWGSDAGARLIREQHGLFFAEQLKTVTAPKALALDNVGPTHYLLCSLLPQERDTPPIQWNPFYHATWREMQQNFGTPAPLNTIAWRQHCLQNTASESALKYLETKEPASGYQFGPSHGDVATWNAALQKDRLLLFDWENFELQAPRLADPFYFSISRAVYIKKIHALAAIKKIVSKALEEIPHEPEELLLAQVYYLMLLPKNDVRDVIQTLIEETTLKRPVSVV